jgi:hypothetical protein
LCIIQVCRISLFYLRNKFFQGFFIFLILIHIYDLTHLERRSTWLPELGCSLRCASETHGFPTLASLVAFLHGKLPFSDPFPSQICA